MSKGKINNSESKYTTITVLRINRDGINKCKLVKTESVDSALARLIKVYKKCKAKEKIIKIPNEEVLEDIIERLIKKYREYEAVE